jgi:hypothetical protein
MICQDGSSCTGGAEQENAITHMLQHNILIILHMTTSRIGFKLSYMPDHSCPKQEKKINAEHAKVAEEKMQKPKARVHRLSGNLIECC